MLVEINRLVTRQPRGFRLLTAFALVLDEKSVQANTSRKWGLLRRLFKTCSTNWKRHGHPESAHGNSCRRFAGYLKMLPELRPLCLRRRRLILKADWSKTVFERFLKIARRLSANCSMPFADIEN